MNELARLLGGSTDTDTDTAVVERLQVRLAHQAQAHNLLDVAYRTVDSPFGSLLLAATPAGLVRIAYAGEDHDQVLATLADKVSPRVLRAPNRLDEPARQLGDYFANRRHGFDLPIDFQLAHGFRRTVLEWLPHVPYGQTVSYAQLAGDVGSPRAVRAVGTACATNPLPLVIPCHRVVRTDGSLGNYIGGTDTKRQLLQLEHALD
jgi:methylated-DNA-[protein]-cysteine S-methyltransferase